MGGRKVWASGDILTAADVNDYLMDQSVMVFAGTAARASAIASPSEGMVTYRSDDNVVEAYTGAAWQSIGGKILQVVRATDATQRTTTSTSYVDVTGMSVTITPKKSDSTIIVLALFSGRSSGTGTVPAALFRITDSSNNALSGAQSHELTANLVNAGDLYAPCALVGYATPATTSATTYKLRFAAGGANRTAAVENAASTGQMFAIEVSA